MGFEAMPGAVPGSLPYRADAREPVGDEQKRAIATITVNGEFASGT